VTRLRAGRERDVAAAPGAPGSASWSGTAGPVGRDSRRAVHPGGALPVGLVPAVTLGGGCRIGLGAGSGAAAALGAAVLWPWGPWCQWRRRALARGCGGFRRADRPWWRVGTGCGHRRCAVAVPGRVWRFG